MTKHKCDWKPTQLEAAIAAKELHAHTATILGNMRRQAHRTALAESWQSMYNHLAKGNSKRLERRMTEFYNNLEKEIGGAIP